MADTNFTLADMLTAEVRTVAGWRRCVLLTQLIREHQWSWCYLFGNNDTRYLREFLSWSTPSTGIVIFVLAAVMYGTPDDVRVVT